MSPKYSICITCHNEREHVDQSIQSILRQIGDDFELLVVDSASRDGTYEYLKSIASPQVKLFSQKSTRGIGRQIAFKKSSGNYVIANLDMDDIFYPRLRTMMDFYKEKCEGYILGVFNSGQKGIAGKQNITIGNREIIEEIGGWKNFQWGEDWDLWCRAAKIGKYRWTVYQVVEKSNYHPERLKLLSQTRGKMTVRYDRYRNYLKLGRNVFSSEENVRWKQKFVLFLARLSLIFHNIDKDPFRRYFDNFCQNYFIRFDNPVHSDSIMNKTS